MKALEKILRCPSYKDQNQEMVLFVTLARCVCFTLKKHDRKNANAFELGENS